MNTKLLNSLIAKKTPCYFVSPHFDDALLSAASLMRYLSGFTDVVLINVFTKAGNPPYTLSQKAYLKQCNYPDAKSLYRERRKEDAIATKDLAQAIHYLSFTDALWRKKQTPKRLFKLAGRFVPELTHIYPTYKFHVISGKISPLDRQLLQKLEKTLQSIPRDAVVFCPAAIGNHVDHVLVREACLAVSPNVVFWADFPYTERDHSAIVADKDWKRWQFPVNKQEKLDLLQQYQTQFQPMFGQDQHITLPNEVFFSRRLEIQ